MRLLLDTNVVISGLLWRGAAYELLTSLRDRPDVRLFTSGVLLDELAEVLRRPSAAKQLALIGKSVHDVLSDYLDAVDVVDPVATTSEQAPAPPPRFVPTDADDDHVVAAAFAARVEAIITGDRDLLSVGGFGDIKVLTVAALRERLATALSRA
jgi:uncharacterized protein